MKQLLETDFTVAHGRFAETIPVIETIYPSGDFALADAKACGECSYFYKMNC